MRQFHRIRLRLHQQVFDDGGGESLWKTGYGVNGPHSVCLLERFGHERRPWRRRQQHQRRLLSIATHTATHDANDVTVDARNGNGGGGGGDGDGGARPIFFQRSPPLWSLSPLSSSPSSSGSLPTQSNNSKDPLLTPYDFKGSTSVLPPSMWHASPCLGAALASSPLVGNLMRLYQNNDDDGMNVDDGDRCEHHHDNNIDTTVSTAEQAQAVVVTEDTILQWQFHQASSLANRMFFRLLRESPIHLVRNKSWPASYLTPAMIGCFLAEYHHNQIELWCSPSPSPSNTVQELNKKKTEKQTSKKTKATQDEPTNEAFQTTLRDDFGIRSNRIADEWIGISMARWMELNVPPLPPKTMTIIADKSPTSRSRLLLGDTLVPSLWLVALWGVTSSRDELVKDYYGALMKGNDEQSSSQNNKPNAPKSSTRFVPSDFNRVNLEAAMDRLLLHYRDGTTIDQHQEGGGSYVMETATAFELVCAAIAAQHHSTEMSSQQPQPVPNGYYIHRDGDVYVPDCVEVTVREIIQLLLFPLKNENPNKSSTPWDVSRLPSTASPRLQELLKVQEQTEHAQQPDHPLKQQQSDLGQAWFDLLSNLPRCEYFITTPSIKQYELAPTIKNVCTVLWTLLVDEGREEDDHNDEESPQQPWTCLEDVADYWNSVHSSTSAYPSDIHLHMQQDTLRHVQASTGRIMEHEIGSLQLEGSSHAIELRMRCDWDDRSGMAAVTHLREGPVGNVNQQLFQPRQVEALFELLRLRYCKNQDEFSKNYPSHRDPSLAMLCLALAPFNSSDFKALDGDPSQLCLALLTTPYGPDRRELRLKQRHQNHHTSNKEFQQMALKESRKLLRDRIVTTCRQLSQSHHRVCTDLLVWLLQESPTVVDLSTSSMIRSVADSEVETMLLELPQHILEKDALVEAIQWNWACRGRAVSTLIKWRNGKLSVVDISLLVLRGKLRPRDLIDMASLARINPESHQ